MDGGAYFAPLFSYLNSVVARKGEPFRVFRLIPVISNRFGIAAEIADVFADGFQLAEELRQFR